MSLTTAATVVVLVAGQMKCTKKVDKNIYTCTGRRNEKETDRLRERVVKYTLQGYLNVK